MFVPELKMVHFVHMSFIIQDNIKLSKVNDIELVFESPFRLSF